MGPTGRPKTPVMAFAGSLGEDDDSVVMDGDYSEHEEAPVSSEQVNCWAEMGTLLPFLSFLSATLSASLTDPERFNPERFKGTQTWVN